MNLVCESSLDCDIRYECDLSRNSCVCDHTMMFSGENCMKAHPYLTVCFSLLSIYGISVLFASIISLRRKAKTQKITGGKINAAVSTTILAILSCGSTASLTTSNFMYALKVGNQHLLRDHIAPYCISFIGFFIVLCVLNVALFWIELSTSHKTKRSHTNLERTKHILIGSGALYLISVVAVYAVTRNMVLTFPIALLAVFCLSVAIFIGSLRLSRKLDIMAEASLASVTPSNLRRISVDMEEEEKDRKSTQIVCKSYGEKREFRPKKNENVSKKVKDPERRRSSAGSFVMERFAKARHSSEPKSVQGQRIVKYAHRISWRLLTLFIATLGFIITSRIPRSGAATCTFAFAQLWSVISSCYQILHYLDGQNIIHTTVIRMRMEISRYLVDWTKRCIAFIKSMVESTKRRGRRIYLDTDNGSQFSANSSYEKSRSVV